MAKKAKKRKNVLVEKCAMAGCNRSVQHQRMKMCLRCAAWLRYWQGRSRTDLEKRAAQIDFWHIRIHSQID